MAIVLYKSDKTTPLDGTPITNEHAGADSDAIDFWIWNTGTTVAKNVLIVQRTADPELPSNRLAAGVPPQDEQWGRGKLTGTVDATASPGFAVGATDYLPMGAFGGLFAGDIPAGCGVGARYLSHPPADADDLETWTRSIRPIWDEYSQPMPPPLGMVDRGVLTGIGDASRSGVVPVFTGVARNLLAYEAFQPQASATPNATVTLKPGVHLAKGKLVPKLSQALTLNQNDSAGSALTSGQIYYAAVSLVAGVASATKGVRGSSPAKPATPTGATLLGYVRVRYNAAGSAIDATDLTDWSHPYYVDRYTPLAWSGLTLRLTAGQAVGGGTWRYSQGPQDVVLPDNSTSFVWLLASGRPTSTTTNVPPETTALPICQATTASGAITALTDCRIFAGWSAPLTLRGAPPASVGSIQKVVISHEHVVIDLASSLYWASDAGAGASAGQALFDLKRNGTTLFTNSATEDRRPGWAWNASAPALISGSPLPEVVDLYRGDVLELLSVTNPTGGRPAEVGAFLVVRKAAA